MAVLSSNRIESDLVPFCAYATSVVFEPGLEYVSDFQSMTSSSVARKAGYEVETSDRQWLPQSNLNVPV
jgi:hypothetical protein